MDFSAWSSSHLIVAALALATIIGQAIAVLARLKANTEQLQKQSETFVHAIERLEDRMDKHFVEVNQRISEVRSELKTEMSEIRSELSKMNQNHIDHLSHHESRGDKSPP